MRLFGERIDDRHAAPGETVLHVFREQNVAIGMRRRGQDDGVPDLEPVIDGHVGGAQQDFRNCVDNDKEVHPIQHGLTRSLPWVLRLALKDIEQLAERLGRDNEGFRSNASNHVPGCLPELLAVRAFRIDQNVGVERDLQRSRS